MTHRENETRDDIVGALDEYFNRGVDKKKFLDVSRIPLICQDIKQIRDDLEELKDSHKWVSRVVIGAVIVGVVTMILK